MGYLNSNQGLADRMQSRSGLTCINEKDLHEILRLSILKQVNGWSYTSAGQMITGLPYPLPESSPLVADLRFRSLLMPQSSGTNAGTKFGENDSISAFLTMVKASIPLEGLVPEAMKLMNKQIVRALGLTTDVEESKSLSSYGIDSLAAVDLRNWLKVHLGVHLTTLDILNAATLRSLCLKVVERLVEGRAEALPVEAK